MQGSPVWQHGEGEPGPSARLPTPAPDHEHHHEHLWLIEWAEPGERDDDLCIEWQCAERDCDAYITTTLVAPRPDALRAVDLAGGAP
jgi:hypothetical protein